MVCASRPRIATAASTSTTFRPRVVAGRGRDRRRFGSVWRRRARGVVKLPYQSRLRGLGLERRGGHHRSRLRRPRRRIGRLGHAVRRSLAFRGSLQNQNIDPIDPDPTELGDWFGRYGIVANPAWTSAASNATEPQRLVLPDVQPRCTLRRAESALRRMPQVRAVPFVIGGVNQVGLNFNIAGTGSCHSRPATSSAPRPRINRAAPKPRSPTSLRHARSTRRKSSSATSSPASRSMPTTRRVHDELFGGQTESNDYNQRGIPHLSGIWNGRVYNTNPYLPGERTPGDARVRASTRSSSRNKAPS